MMANGGRPTTAWVRRPRDPVVSWIGHALFLLGLVLEDQFTLEHEGVFGDDRVSGGEAGGDFLAVAGVAETPETF